MNQIVHFTNFIIYRSITQSEISLQLVNWGLHLNIGLNCTQDTSSNKNIKFFAAFECPRKLLGTFNICVCENAVHFLFQAWRLCCKKDVLFLAWLSCLTNIYGPFISHKQHEWPLFLSSEMSSPSSWSARRHLSAFLLLSPQLGVFHLSPPPSHLKCEK